MSKKGDDRAYVRVSTLKDSQKDSPEHQEAFIRETAKRMNIEISKVYEDRDSATSIIDREDVQLLIEDAKRGEIRSLFFTSLSRFSRDALDAISLKRILVNALKIRVISIEDGYDSGIKDDELLFGIKSVVNQNTSGDISVSSRRGIRQSAEKGNYTGTIPPYGYKKVVVDGRKTLEVIPEQAAIVKKIFNLYVNGGKGEKAIVNILNEEGIPSYKGGLWGISSVQRILQNENYTGFTVFGRHTTEVTYNDLSNLMNRGKKLVQKPKTEWEKTKFQTHEAIIEPDLFERAKEIRIIRGGGERGGRRSFVNVFAKMVFCSHCGTAMVSMSSLVRGTQYRYLMCSRRRRVGETGCVNGKWIPYNEMRDELIGLILEILREKVARFDAGGVTEIEASLPENSNRRDRTKIEKKINDCRTLLFEIRRQHMLGDIDERQYEFEKSMYEKDIDEAEKRLRVIEASEKLTLDMEKNYKEIRAVLKAFTRLSSYDDVEQTRSLLLRVVQRITIDKDGEINAEVIV